MNKLHSSQLFAILFLSGAWTVMCMPAISSGDQLTGILAATALQIPAVLLLNALHRQGFSLSKTVSQKKWLGFVYVLCILLQGAQAFSQLWAAAPRISLPVSGRLTAAVLITIICLYTCSLGLQALSRSAPFVLGFLLLTLIVLVIGALPRLDTVRFTIGTSGIQENCAAYLCTSGELITVLILLDRMQQKGGRRAVLCYLIAKALLAGLLVFLCVCVCGRLLELEDYPFFTLTALSQPLRAQRADALYLIAFQILFIMHITLLTGTGAHLLHSMFPRLRAVSPFCLAGMILLSLVPVLPDSRLLQGSGILLTAVLIPLAFYLIRRCSHEQTPAPPAAPDASDGLRQGQHQ